MRLGVLATSLAAAWSHQAQGQFWFMGPNSDGSYNTQVRGLSADGRVAVGERGAGGFRWTAETGRVNFRDLDPDLPLEITPHAVSSNGGTIVGGHNAGAGHGYAFRYRGPESFQSLGTLPGWHNSYGLGVSGDGEVVVGQATDERAFVGQAFRWTAATGMVGLGWTPGGVGWSKANAVSRDGSTTVGESSGGVTDAVMWDAEGRATILPPLPGLPEAIAYGVNHDGTVAVGYSNGSAVMWRGGNVIDLGAPLGGRALGVSDDGSVVVGSIGGFTSPRMASVWIDQGGPQTLASVLALHRMSVPSGWTLEESTAVSADGRTIAGWARFNGPDYAVQGFVVTIPTPGPLVLALAASSVFLRRRIR
jgi:uncharacterized membrane protein